MTFYPKQAFLNLNWHNLLKATEALTKKILHHHWQNFNCFYWISWLLAENREFTEFFYRYTQVFFRTKEHCSGKVVVVFRFPSINSHAVFCQLGLPVCQCWQRIDWRIIESLQNFSFVILKFLKEKVWSEKLFIVPCSPSNVHHSNYRHLSCQLRNIGGISNGEYSKKVYWSVVWK